MRIDLDCLLWRTRGHKWDYSFVLRPNLPVIEWWYDFHEGIFSGITPSIHPKNIGGILHTNGKKYPFIATAFQDVDAKDEAGRSVAHFLVWFHSPEHDDTASLEVPAGWGSEVVRAFGPDWRSAFAGNDDPDVDLLAAARTRLKSVMLSGDNPVIVALEHQVIQKKKSRAPKRISRRLLMIAGAALFLILLLIWLASQEVT
ncbi:MAG: hypothetical protein H0U74_19620 [Bradymonadaceae bacterium]|nr:hypothetical protein [Lujinxingiaceae bacterium]